MRSILVLTAIAIGLAVAPVSADHLKGKAEEHDKMTTKASDKKMHEHPCPTPKKKEPKAAPMQKEEED